MKMLIQPVGADTQSTFKFITLVVRHPAEGSGREEMLIAFTGVRRVNDRFHQHRWNRLDILRGDALFLQQCLPRPPKRGGHYQSFFSTERHSTSPVNGP